MDDRGNIRGFATKEDAVAAGFPHEVPAAFLADMPIAPGIGEAKRAAFDRAMNAIPSGGPRPAPTFANRSTGSFCPSIKSRFKQRKLS